MSKILVIIFLSINLINCASSPGNTNDNIVPLKYPVILVHGIIAHDRWNFYSFWGRIPAVLESRGVRVFFGNTDSWGSYESNAETLKETIDTVLQITNSEKVNIIAHSKGGLDARYFIWKHDYGDKVASLTTISTPHRGAELADAILDRKIVHSYFVRRILSIFGMMYGDDNPDLYNIINTLSTAHMERFNDEVIMDERVYFQSMYCSMNKSTDDLFFYSSHRYIGRISGANDGVVSEFSANWGDNVRKIFGAINHIEIIDIKMRDISGINIPDIYIEIVRDLAERGF